jgi:beta-glucosidase
MGIEPTSEAWEASILPLYDARSLQRNDYTQSTNARYSPVYSPNIRRGVGKQNLTCRSSGGKQVPTTRRLLQLVCLSAILSLLAFAQLSSQSSESTRPWMNRSLSPDERAELVLKQMTVDEKLGMLHGQGMPGWGAPRPNAYLGNGGAGFVLGIERLGLPFIQISDAAYGVRASAANGRYSTALPSNLASAASWDPHAACEYGALIGRELRAQGYNMSLGGGVNLAREPRNGRTFEYMGEDPILAGTLVGNRIKCEQAQHVIGHIKHFALNDQESGRNEVNVIIDRRSMRESDLLAFEIGIQIGQPGAVMCSYNLINGQYACQNKWLLTDLLKHDWHFPGFVISDWGATHTTVEASAAGLDNEQPLGLLFGEKFKAALQAGQIQQSQLDDHVRRILRSEFAAGIIDHPLEKSAIDVEAGFETSRTIAEQSIVLLKNANKALPLDRNSLHSIAVIGEKADTSMISGGGSAQVDPPGPPPAWLQHVWFPTSPLKAVRAQAPHAKVTFDSGADPAKAAAMAKQADAAIIFVHQWTSEDMDLPNLSLPNNQDQIIDQVASANPRTIVVLETGSVVTMPWLNKAAGVLEAWYAGNKGAEAVANILFGNVNASAKLPISFPNSEQDLPHPTLAKPPQTATPPDNVDHPELTKSTFSVHYDEGMKVGYKWYDAENKPVLFPFGFGLSYTTYAYSGLKVSASRETTTAQFTVKNTGNRAGDEIAQVYASLPEAAHEPPKRLVGWSKIHLEPGESKQVTVEIPAKYLSIFDDSANVWKVVPGAYKFLVGGSSQDLPLKESASL